MKSLLKISIILLLTSMFFTRCELIKHGKEAFLGNYTNDIDYANSIVEFAIDNDIDGDHNPNTSPPPESAYAPFDSASTITFIDSYFSEGPASIFSTGNDSVKYTDNKRILYGCVKGDSVVFKTSDLGSAPPVNGVVINYTVLNTKGISISNDIHMNHVFFGTGSVAFPTDTLYGIVRGTVKIIARK